VEENTGKKSLTSDKGFDKINKRLENGHEENGSKKAVDKPFGV
jgi:hypothetical protein